MTIARVRVAAAASLLLLAAGCAQESPTDTAAAPEAVSDSDGLALRVSQTGGFVTPAMLVAQLPAISVYRDGRVITEGPTTLVYPGPALPNVQVRQISTADVDKLVARAVDAGVGSAGDLGQPPVADVPSTRFTVVTSESDTRTTEVYALGEATDQTSSGLTEAQKTARIKLRDLLAALTDLPTTLGAGAVGAEQPYQPVAVAAVATPWVAPDASLGKQPAVAWPGPALPGQSVGKGLDTGCVTVSGADTAKVLAAAGKANAATAWTSGGKSWTVALRPLLPDETDCADIVDA